MMARYQVIIGYDGTAFSGMQRQANADTVQGAVENALRQIGWQGSSLLAAGRTDAGVHAAGQVVAFDLDWQHPLIDLQNALNANLPPEISVRDVRQAPPEFHPRFDALSRTYEYRIITEPTRNPLRERYAWRVWPQPEHALLQTCAGLLIGEHDFAAFGTSPIEGGATIRNVYRSEWQFSGSEIRYLVCANAFLYHMVRRMVFLQVEIALGKAEIETLTAALADSAAGIIQGLAPAHGLVLLAVEYPPEVS
jgi:tRNA pseudouridine38-40 synthase